MEMTIIMLALLAFGAWKAWRQISTGSGMICSRFSPVLLESLNSSQGYLKKIVLSLVLGYLILAGMIIKFVILLGIKLADGSLFRN